KTILTFDGNFWERPSGIYPREPGPYFEPMVLLLQIRRGLYHFMYGGWLVACMMWLVASHRKFIDPRRWAIQLLLIAATATFLAISAASSFNSNSKVSPTMRIHGRPRASSSPSNSMRDRPHMRVALGLEIRSLS